MHGIDVYTNIRATKLLFYLRFMEERGFSEHQVLQGTGLIAYRLKNPHSFVQAHQYVQVVSNMKRLTQMPELAFALGEQLRLGDLGVLGHAISSCSNAGQAIEKWLMHNWLFFGTFFSDMITRRGNLMCYEFIPRVQLLPQMLQFFIEEKMNIDVALFHRLNNIPLPSRSCCLAYPAPPHADLYESLLGIPVTFGSQKNEMRVHAQKLGLESPLPGADKETLHVLDAYIDGISRAVNSETTFSARVRYDIKVSLPNVLTVEEFASQMKISSRTFARRLSQEGTNYSSLLENVRANMAKNRLSTTQIKTEDLSFMLGFSDSASFRRAFKAWTGTSVSEFKANVSNNKLPSD